MKKLRSMDNVDSSKLLLAVQSHDQDSTLPKPGKDFLELDDDEHCYGLATRPLAEGRGPPDAQEPKLVKTTIQPQVKLPVVLSRATESSNPSTLMIGTGNNGISLSSSEKENVAIQSDVLSESVILFDKPNGTDDSVLLFRLNSKTVDSTPLPFKSVSEKSESKSENSIRLVVTPPVVNYGGNSMATSVTSSASISSIGKSGIFNFGASSSASTSAASNIFGSTWESPKPLVFSSTFTTSSPSSIFSFGASSSTLGPANAGPANATSTMFNSQFGPSSSPFFPFSTSSSPAFSLPSASLNQPIFGNGHSRFAASPFQASGSLGFNTSCSFSLGSGGADKSSRKFVKVNRNKNRKK